MLSFTFHILKFISLDKTSLLNVCYIYLFGAFVPSNCDLHIIDIALKNINIYMCCLTYK